MFAKQGMIVTPKCLWSKDICVNKILHSFLPILRCLQHQPPLPTYDEEALNKWSLESDVDTRLSAFLLLRVRHIYKMNFNRNCKN